MNKITITIFLFLVSFCGVLAQSAAVSPNEKLIQGRQTGRLPQPNRLQQDSVGQLPENFSSNNAPTPEQTAPMPKGKVDTMALKLASAYVWKITPRFGEQIRVVEDTARINFHQSSLADGKDVIVGYLGNLGSPAQSKVFFNRPEPSRFIFGDAIRYWRKLPEDQIFRNTQIPYSNIHYQSGGSGEIKEEDFKVEISSNFGKNFNAGFNVDYIYARGVYTSLYNKQLSYNLYGSYTGNKYQMHAYIVNNNHLESENGGVSNPLFITNPNDESIRRYTITGSSLNIPVYISQGLFNRLRARHVYITNRYDLGDDMEEYAVNDSITRWRKKKDYIAPASIILTTHYTDQQRRVYDTGRNKIDSLFLPYNDAQGNVLPNFDSHGEVRYGQAKYTLPMNDLMAYYSIKNTFALAMNEGFRSWTKFGLTAFIEYDKRKYSSPSAFRGINKRYDQNALFVGGTLSKVNGKYLRYKGSAEKDLLNSDFRLQGELTTMLYLKDKEVSAKAQAYIKNITPSFFDNHFSTKYKTWSRDFGDIRRVFVGGELQIPFTDTKISGGVENLQNFIYSGADSIVTQHSKNVQVVSLRLDQKLQAGIFHWDNQLVYQATSDDRVVPLPTLGLYSNLYMSTRVAKVLSLQIGVDAHIHTKYYVPGFEPLTMRFYNQRDKQLGNFPISTAYLNVHLKNTRFFLMMYNVAQGMGNSESFSLYRYPVMPQKVKIGLSWNFFN